MLGRAHLDRSNGDLEAIVGSVLVYPLMSRAELGGVAGVLSELKAERSVQV